MVSYKAAAERFDFGCGYDIVQYRNGLWHRIGSGELQRYYIFSYRS